MKPKRDGYWKHVSARVPRDLYDRFRAWLASSGYASFSEWLRSRMREEVEGGGGG